MSNRGRFQGIQGPKLKHLWRKTICRYLLLEKLSSSMSWLWLRIKRLFHIPSILTLMSWCFVEITLVIMFWYHVDILHAKECSFCHWLLSSAVLIQQATCFSLSSLFCTSDLYQQISMFCWTSLLLMTAKSRIAITSVNFIFLKRAAKCHFWEFLSEFELPNSDSCYLTLWEP